MRHTSPLEGGAQPTGGAAFIVSAYKNLILNFRRIYFANKPVAQLLQAGFVI